MVLHKKSLSISWHYKKTFTSSWSEISKHSEEIATIKKKKKKNRKKIYLGERKFGPRLGQDNFSDKNSFWTRSSIHHTWSTHTNRLIQRTIKHPIKVHIWVFFSKQGFGTLYIFINNLNAAKIVKIYQRALLPFVQRLFMRKNENWLLQQDNDSKHRSRLCIA